MAVAAPGPPPPRAAAETVEPAPLTEDTMDSILGRELHQLSLQDREAINEEIHGVHTLAVPETPDFVGRRLEEMEQALLLMHRQQHQQDLAVGGGDTVGGHGRTTVSTDTGKAYREALLLGSQYVHDQNFRLMFLRADLFDATKAALRLVNFLQIVRDYLGPEALVNKPWTLKLFGPDEHRALRWGVYQIFPGRDRAGRRVHGVMDDYGEATVLTIVSGETSRRVLCGSMICAINAVAGPGGLVSHSLLLLSTACSSNLACT
jgi:hypothetical protein